MLDLIIVLAPDKKTASDLAAYFDGQVEVISPVLDQGEKISSTRIRQAILEGRVKKLPVYLVTLYPVGESSCMGMRVAAPLAILPPI